MREVEPAVGSKREKQHQTVQTEAYVQKSRLHKMANALTFVELMLMPQRNDVTHLSAPKTTVTAISVSAFLESFTMLSGTASAEAAMKIASTHSTRKRE